MDQTEKYTRNTASKALLTFHAIMSGGYASRLSHYPNKGVCGLPECSETSRSLTVKISKLAKLMQSCRRIVVLTGAGISTAAGISDFRGPSGIWTLENERAKGQPSQKRRRGEDRSDSTSINDEADKKNELFSCVEPTYTHRALSKLLAENVIRYIVTQNVDGLHLRSGIPRSSLSILHGDCFVERCESCGQDYLRDFDLGGLSFKKTGRFCDGAQAIGRSRTAQGHCGGALRDTILDWDDELPEVDFANAESECTDADLVIALGTSLRIVPAGQLPLKAKRFVIVNLQRTPYDSRASIVIHHKVDEVMKILLDKLSIRCI